MFAPNGEEAREGASFKHSMVHLPPMGIRAIISSSPLSRFLFPSFFAGIPLSHTSFMLLSHCGEYMANGLTNAVRHEFVIIANDRQTFVSVHSIRGRFCVVSNVILVSPVANVWRMGLRMPFAINSQ